MKKEKGIVCMYCGRDIDFTADGRWVHDDGNAYAYECANCGWFNTSYVARDICPNCGLKLVLCHPAYPLLIEEEWEKL